MPSMDYPTSAATYLVKFLKQKGRSVGVTREVEE